MVAALSDVEIFRKDLCARAMHRWFEQNGVRPLQQQRRRQTGLMSRSVLALDAFYAAVIARLRWFFWVFFSCCLARITTPKGVAHERLSFRRQLKIYQHQSGAFIDRCAVNRTGRSCEMQLLMSQMRGAGNVKRVFYGTDTNCREPPSR